MENCNTVKNSILLQNPITQVAGLPYASYLSLLGKYFLGSTGGLKFGNGKSAWAGLFNPTDSGVNLHVYVWQVANIGEAPIRAQIWFNSDPPGKAAIVRAVTPANTALCPLPKPRILMLKSDNVSGDPEGGVKAFVRRAQPDITIGDNEVGKFIFPPGGSFLIFLSDPETPTETAKATVSYEWWEEKITC